jgi:hypothetical protein
MSQKVKPRATQTPQPGCGTGAARGLATATAFMNPVLDAYPCFTLEPPLLGAREPPRLSICMPDELIKRFYAQI